jgi:hypothetical protein
MTEPTPSPQVATLVRWKEQLGLRSLEVSTACGIDPAKFSKWERGYARLDDLQTVEVVNYLVGRLASLSSAIPVAQQELQEIKQQVSA